MSIRRSQQASFANDTIRQPDLLDAGRESKPTGWRLLLLWSMLGLLIALGYGLFRVLSPSLSLEGRLADGLTETDRAEAAAASMTAPTLVKPDDAEPQRPQPALASDNKRSSPADDRNTQPASPSGVSRSNMPAPVLSGDDLLNELLWQLNRGGDSGAPDYQELRRLLTELRAQGAAALPALEDFLLSGEEVVFDPDAKLRRPTLRLMLLDILNGIDDPAALEVMLDVLATTIEPLEIGALAGYLEQRAAGMYRQPLVAATREALISAQHAPGLFADDELGVLFQMLGEYGGAAELAELRQVPRHQEQYAAVALALLPDGEGVSELLDSVQRPGADLGNLHGRLTLQLLAQVAAEQPAAADALSEIARQGRVPPQLWPQLSGLAGGLERIELQPRGDIVNRHQISRPGGEQVLYRVRADMPRDSSQVRARLEVVEQLLDAGDSDAAHQALLPVRDRLLAPALSIDR